MHRTTPCSHSLEAHMSGIPLPICYLRHPTTPRLQRGNYVLLPALLGQVGRRQVDGDAFGRQREARGRQRRAHPLA